MGRAYCGCLNVRINTKGDLSTSVMFSADSLELQESQDSFFQQAPKEVMLDLAGVTIEHGYLIQSRVVGRWNLFHCLCCKMDTHGVPNKSPLPFLANSSLLTDPFEVSLLQQSDRFSPVYKIILPLLGNSGPSSPRNFPVKGSKSDQVVASLQQVMSSFLKKEEEKIEEKIQRFTEQQQAALISLETRARQDRNTILKLLAEKESLEEEKMRSLSLKSEITPPTTPTKPGSTFHFLTASSNSKMPLTGRHVVEHPDDDILFEFDSEDPNASTGDPFDASEFENEDSSRDEGISIPRSRGAPMSDYDSGLAKSLPMRVPTLTNYRTQDIDIEDDKTPQNDTEMAASIKALARSVHGSDSFWDLPRPRLNTLH